MKTHLKLAAALASVALAASVHAEGFLRPEVSYTFASVSVPGFSIDLDNAFGYGVAGGATFGGEGQHEVGVSIGVLDYSVSTSLAGATGSGKVKTVPYVATYRYYFGPKTAPARFYLGGAAGWANVKVNASVTSGGITARASESDTDFVWGVGLGAVFKVTERVDIDAGYRYQELQQPVGAVDAKIKSNTLYAGVNFRF
jgi:opacity protein-like surface antigen